MNAWIDVKKKRPECGQEVLVYCQGYDITGTRHWSHFDLAVYDVDYDDRRKHAYYLVSEYTYRIAQDGSTLRNMWKKRDVTHWMPLPESPPAISRDDYEKMTGQKYEGRR